MFKKILIANRGEIAVRIIRACHELGIAAVAIYSESDKESLHVKLADETYCIGKTSAKDTYLNMNSIIEVAIHSKSDAIHPGYGFLSESSTFARACEEFNICFIGPDYRIIDSLGDKSNAKETMKRADVPVVMGSEGEIEDKDRAMEMAQKIGYPVIVKASAGGGGKGMRVARNREDLAVAIEESEKEAENYFGNPAVYLEKYLEDTRHVEIQIIGDNYGNVVYLGERDCTIQRRHQKLLEESPSPAMNDELRKIMGNAAVRACRAVNYNSLGTVEFLLDSDNKFYFMEMNTRVQVEHGVTEMTTGIDLIKEQISIAEGKKLSFSQCDVKRNGCAIECRVNAENPYKNFIPSPGKINNYIAPGGIGIRIDSSVYSGYTIPPFYDSMISKVIAWGRDRNEAIARMRRALDEFVIEGVDTTIDFHKKLMQNDIFKSGNFNTKFLEKNNIL
ncbi:MAG: acetyl-CoA carboxylase biotin carboxylase subunit [Clostridium sp.]|jgi:acetyl-CoA carboxylase biotin carboxylase subunit|uniref:acetyl-CoA carboxylase biotin carboxylase subunit n=1 Tax=Clostridium sp. TaxID=1506 RepID=UPI0025BFB708|nr:acetyl-CoA carboxylase biotin carboxylase subunit [Clostridium sp.]MCH3963519.1 acetyl-CoA carboxylase biotin carboxylase subunit [Clostridium sp.]MCI1714660.1 acetyl-CoA carboxylase biotin carboxylase subunit [Clostridium sp.]MCI1799151.1 acetyl-CoA carboxylase biotin carboxylase subunit [Clostridium sp.]MCI1812843.1 acetyl-CoA carboxylase biotin carboxylase subunit [Clostridium sp.]MCI1869733.1 acetyl-CoA carboxylase biotin carboxylase subunit [Clostridium sp.]